MAARHALASLSGDLLERARDHLARGEAHQRCGEVQAARAQFQQALAIDVNLAPAYNALAALNLPGPHYYDWLRWIYGLLAPASLVEIGIAEGGSLAQAPAGTLVIGVDPAPHEEMPVGAGARLFRETSDSFFAAKHLDSLLGGRPLDVGFVDGLHLFEQVLRDFRNLEAHCGPGSALLIHDTLPLDEVTQRRAKVTDFWSGDVWRIVPCLKAYRPELDLVTVATQPTGLTIVTGLDSRSTVLAEREAEICARFLAMPYEELRGREPGMLNLVPNTWNEVAHRLQRLRRRELA